MELWESVSNYGSSAWDSAAEFLGESWDVVTDAAEDKFAEVVQSVKDSGVDPATVRANEPEKATNPDGSPVVLRPTQSAGVQPKQYIQGIDNTVVMVGGGFALLLLALVVVKAVK